ncbi:hypothetical protein [Rhodanobacter sp. MP1X3]|uniref:hypothetical protein n=1 Tax=Rhodanobacter sp. MP1X3 TaxID=2723086 RepID=UPI00160E75CC|nr:hypothetical protein [Rhodanobacter sp. MP1X3]MBB6240807.1 hypothetical protein [Rhodanobacter sp. MP1X3]
MREEDASEIAKPLELAICQLSISLAAAQSVLGASEFAQFKRVVGIAIGNISYELLGPIYVQHPGLAPSGLRDT